MSSGRRFVLAAFFVAIPLAALALSPRTLAVLHALLLILGVGALWPLVFFALALLVALMGGLMGGHEGGALAGEALARVGVASSRRYVGFLRRLRHPVGWGVAVGLLTGALGGLGLVAALRLPGESRTQRILDTSAAALEAAYETHHAYPDEVSGQLRLEGTDGPVLDGFGRAIRYQRSGSHFTARYRLRSAGYDGRFETDDDLCVDREARVLRQGSALAARGLRRLGGRSADWAEIFAELRADTCR